MNFEHPQETPKELPASGRLKKGAALVAMLGALSGVFEQTASATGETKKEKATSQEKILETLKNEADARWTERLEIRTELEGRGPDGKTVLYYAGETKMPEGSQDEPEKAVGLTIIDEGDSATDGDERWVDLELNSEHPENDVDAWVADNAGGTFGGIIDDGAFAGEVHTLKENPDALASIKENSEYFESVVEAAGRADEWYWSAYALNVVGQGESQTCKEVMKSIDVFGSEFFGKFMSYFDFSEKSKADLEVVRHRLLGKIATLSSTKPDFKERNAPSE